MPHLRPPSVSPKVSQRPTGSCTSQCRSDYEENWNLRLKGVWGWGALTLLQSVSGPPHGALPPQITPILSLLVAAAASLSFLPCFRLPVCL